MENKEVVELFLKPKSVAVIGASKNLAKGGNRIVGNILSNNFEGRVYPINPNAKGKLYGIEFKKSVLDIEEEVDLAIFYVPNKVIPGILEECVEKGVKGALIEASGFEEWGDEGLKLRDQILKITDNFSKIRIVGPNCMGTSRIDVDSNSKEKGGFFNAFAPFIKYKRGNVAIISQSGMLNGGYLLHVMDKYPDMGFRYACSIGNKMDLSEIEFLEYFLDDPTVNVIGLYLESFKDPNRFIELCKKAKKIQNKTIILVKGGLSSQGQTASLSHTAALSENVNLIDGLIKQAGIIRAHCFHELFQYARTFSMMYNSGIKMPKNGNVSMITDSGGAGTITADLSAKYGIKFPPLREQSYQNMVKIFPEWMPPNRIALVDFWPAIEKAMMEGRNLREVTKIVYDAILGDPQVEGLFYMMFCSRMSRAMNNINKIIDTVEYYSKPVFFWLVGEQKEIARVSGILAERNIPEFVSLEEMVKNFIILVQESKNKRI